MENKFEEDSGNKPLDQVNATAERELQAVTNDSKSLADSSVNSSPQEQLQMDTPAGGDCLFWAVMLGMLVRFKDSDNFQTVVSRLFGEEDAKANADNLRDRLLPTYQGLVSDITNFDTEHHFHALMMRFRARVANHIAQTSELQSSIEGGDAKAYGQKMSTAGTWGGEIEIKGMASLLETDIVVRRQGERERRVPANAERVTMDALHIAHVPAASGSPANNHYHFLVPKSHAYWPLNNKTDGHIININDAKQEVPPNNITTPSPIEQAARACVAKYNTWCSYSYLEMNLLVELLKSRRAGLPRDLSFDNKILWILVHSNKDCLEQKDENVLESQHNEIIRLFLIKCNRGDQYFFCFYKGKDAKFPEAVNLLLWPLKKILVEQIMAERNAQANERHDSKAYILNKLNEDIILSILSFLHVTDQVSLVSSAKKLYGRSLIKPINKLLYFVDRSSLWKAEAMIQESSNLLLESGDIRDGAGRHFKNFTALQKAVWAWDAPMVNMMLRYFVRYNIRNTIATQISALDKEGTIYSPRFDFRPLLNAYRVYMDYIHEDFKTRQQQCRDIGRAQWDLPDNVVKNITESAREAAEFYGERSWSKERGYWLYFLSRPRRRDDLRLSFRYTPKEKILDWEWYEGERVCVGEHYEASGPERLVWMRRSAEMMRVGEEDIRANYQQFQELSTSRSQEIEELLSPFRTPTQTSEHKSPGRR